MEFRKQDSQKKFRQYLSIGSLKGWSYGAAAPPDFRVPLIFATEILFGQLIPPDLVTFLHQCISSHKRFIPLNLIVCAKYHNS